MMRDDGARRHSGGLAVCKETSAAEEFGYIGRQMNSMSLGFLLPVPPSSFSQSLSLQSSWWFILPALLASLFSLPASLPYFASLPLLPPHTHHIDWHEPISKTLISTKPQGTHCLQLFSCLTQSCRAVRTHNDTEEWNPWRYLNIINISWR